MAFKLTDPKRIESEDERRGDEQFRVQALETLAKRRKGLLTLWKLGVLSFDPVDSVVLTAARTAEIMFVGGLLEAGIEVIEIPEIVADLDRPLSYPVEKMHFDWASRRWYQLVETPPETGLIEKIAQLAQERDIDALRVVSLSALEAMSTIAEGLVNAAAPLSDQADGRETRRPKHVTPEDDEVDDGNRPSAVSGQGIGVHYRGTWHPCPSAVRAVFKLVGLIAEEQNHFLEVFSDLSKGRTRMFVARNRLDLYPKDPDLCVRESLQIKPGWYMATNHSRASLERKAIEACDAADLRYGVDAWVVVNG